MAKNKKEKFPLDLNLDSSLCSELRTDLINKDWVIIAPARAKRPCAFETQKKKIKILKKECPFCQIGEQEKPTLILIKGDKISLERKIPKDWTIIVFPNKYPALIPFLHELLLRKSKVSRRERSSLRLHKLSKKAKCQEETKFLRLGFDSKKEEEFYQKINAIGFHEVFVTRDHKKQLAQLSVAEIKEVIDAYCFRYLALKDEKFVNQILIFHNHGVGAGASIAHPHSQIVAIPFINSGLKKNLLFSKKYYRSKKKCIHCEINKWEQKIKKRIIFENKEFLAFCPFVPKADFEVTISPKRHLSCFEKITEKQKRYLAEAFKAVLYKLYKGLANPSYNFYLQTSPCDGREHSYYHWHWTILPKKEGGKNPAIMILTVEPEKAAAYLRKQ